VRDQIAERLRNEILADTIPSNEPLREVALAERFGTSRGPIRDVLLELTKEGALVYKPNAGVRVCPPLGDQDSHASHISTLFLSLVQTVHCA
jgi:DNA-binding GntR family transcriptional regulator